MRRGLIALGTLLMICCARSADAPVVGEMPDLSEVASLIDPAPEAEPRYNVMPDTPPTLIIPHLRMKCYPLAMDKDTNLLFSLCWSVLPFPEQPGKQPDFLPPPSPEDLEA